MIDPVTGAEKVEVQPPAGSPPPMVDKNGNPVQPPSEGAKTSVEQKPFNETMKELMSNPEFQDYIKRQNREEVQVGVQRELEKLGVNIQPKEDESEKLAQEFVAETGIDIGQARALVKFTNKIAESKVKPIQDTQQVSAQTQALSMRVQQVKRKFNDVDEVSDKMWKMFNGMDEFSQSFVLNSPDGVEWLYAKAKNGHVVVTSQDKLAGGSVGGRGSSPVSKIEDETALAQSASNALKSGDRAGYEKYAKDLLSSKK